MIDSTDKLKRQARWTNQPKFSRQQTTPQKVADHKARIRRLCGTDLAEVEATLRSAVASRYPEINQISKQAAALGGKRLRPILTLLSARAVHQKEQFSARQHADLIALCCSVELVHAASLVHDDIMDDAALRRGLPTVGKLAGNSTAVLLGDYLFTHAYGLAATVRSSFGARRIAKAATKLCEGEICQQLSAGDWNLTPREYRRLLTEKTGALTAACCELGGWVARCTTEQRVAFRRFGTQLGLAFQIYDDWLDYWGSDSVGKTLGTDLRGGKVTLPLLRLLRQSRPAQRGELIALLETIRSHPASQTTSEIRQLCKHLNRSDASAYTLHVASQCAENAIGHLEAVNDSDAKDCLIDIATYSVNRDC